MRVLKWIGWSLAGGVGLALIASGALIAIDQAGAPPRPDRAALIARAGAYHVRIRRDEWGVPHVLGDRDADAAFGLAYAHAEDDFDTLQDVALAVRGQLAGKAGSKAAVTDYVVNLMGVWDTIAARYDRDLPDDLKVVLQAYADGLNYYAALHPAKVADRLLPLTAKDVAAGFILKTPFFYGLDTTLAQLNALPAPKGDAKGSNAIAIAPAHAADGATRLLVNSHQPYTGPVAWYEAVVQSGEGWHMAGGMFPGAPFILHGFGEHLGWASTVNQPDLVDVYRLTLNPQNHNQYRLDDRWVDFTRTDAALRIKLLGPLVITIHKPVLHSAHGPVLETKSGLYALRYAGMGEVRQALQFYRMNKAQDREAWLAAMRLQALPSLNDVYADAKGNIGYVYNGQFPNRPQGRMVGGRPVDWTGVLPGDRSDLIWNGYLPFDRIPQIWRPASGYVFNSNNTPFFATAPADALKPQDFPATMGIQTNMTNRALRAQETYGADPRITDERFHRYKYDLTYSRASAEWRTIQALVAVDAQGDADLRAAQAVLRTWDGRMDIHNRQAALASLTLQPILFAQNRGEAGPAPIDSLRAAMRTLKDHFGRLDPEWGQVNRIRRGTVDLPIDGGPDTYRAVWGKPQPDGTLTGQGGDTLVIFVTWDHAGRVHADDIHQFGTATLDATSPHYADETPLFAAMKTKPVLFFEDQLKGHVREDYAPGHRSSDR